jgi:hypothetical protein
LLYMLLFWPILANFFLLSFAGANSELLPN